MPILFAGTSMADFDLLGGTRDVGTGSTTRSPNVIESVYGQGGTARNRAIFAAPATEFWLTAYLYTPSTGYIGSNIGLSLSSSTGADVFALYSPTTATNIYAALADGSSFQPAGSSFAFASALCRIDLYYKLSATNGRFSLYRDGTLIKDFTGNTNVVGAPDISRLDFRSFSGSGMYFSAVIAHTEDTRRLDMVQLLPNGDGTQTEWMGNYQAVDETGYSDTDIISSSSAGQVETFLLPDLPAGYSSFSIAGVVLGMRAQGSGSPGEIRGVARISGVDYEQAPVSPLQPGWGPHKVIFENNPASAARWTQADINAAEFGVKSV